MSKWRDLITFYRADESNEFYADENSSESEFRAIEAIQSIKFNYELATRANELTGQNRRNYAGSRADREGKIDFPQTVNTGVGFSRLLDPCRILSSWNLSSRGSIVVSERSMGRGEASTPRC